MGYFSYPEMMEQTNAHLTITLDLKEPVEIEHFAALFAGLGSQFDAYLREEHKDIHGTARMYVREVRRGSIVADLFAQIPDMIGVMDSVLIIGGFASLFSKRLRNFIAGGIWEGASKSDLKHVAETIKAVANDPRGTATLETITYDEDGPQKRLEARFTNHEARRALVAIEAQKAELDKVNAADHERVLMVYTRPDIFDATVGKPSGERVKIEEISDKHLALMYGSQLAEQQIKSAIRNKDSSIWSKGFVVDVNLQSRSGKPVAYSVTNLHQVIDLPDD